MISVIVRTMMIVPKASPTSHALHLNVSCDSRRESKLSSYVRTGPSNLVLALRMAAKKALVNITQSTRLIWVTQNRTLTTLSVGILAK